MTHGDASVPCALCRTAQTSPAFANYAAYVLVLAVLGALTLTLLVATVLRRRLAGAEPDLGWVSERWLAEYRADSTRPSL